MANANGLTIWNILRPTSYPFAALTPINAGSTKGVIHAAELRSVLARLSSALPEVSPFAHVPGTHFARWQVIDDVPQLGCPTEEDRLQSKYLLLESDFDGDRDRWIDAFATAMPETITAVYRHCLGFPGVDDLPTFRRYLVQCQLDTTLGFTPYPTATLPSVLHALETQRRFVGFVRTMQGETDQRRRVAFTDFVKRMRSAPIPLAGQP